MVHWHADLTCEVQVIRTSTQSEKWIAPCGQNLTGYHTPPASRPVLDLPTSLLTLINDVRSLVMVDSSHRQIIVQISRQQSHIQYHHLHQNIHQEMSCKVRRRYCPRLHRPALPRPSLSPAQTSKTASIILYHPLRPACNRKWTSHIFLPPCSLAKLRHLQHYCHRRKPLSSLCLRGQQPTKWLIYIEG
jgi:hypothetical protein